MNKYGVCTVRVRRAVGHVPNAQYKLKTAAARLFLLLLDCVLSVSSIQHILYGSGFVSPFILPHSQRELHKKRIALNLYCTTIQKTAVQSMALHQMSR